jgi:hypothetical protein
MPKLKNWLTHENVMIRAVTLWFTCFALLAVTSFVSYYFLPYSILRGVFPSANLPLGNDFLSAFLTIFLFNLVVGCGLTVALNLLSAKSIPLGYFYPLIQISLYGVFLGTDSFAISHGSRLFPSITLVNGAGFYEFTAYVLVATATARLVLWNQTGWLGGSLIKIKERKELKLSRSELFTVTLGVLLLLVAAAIEANGIMGT